MTAVDQEHVAQRTLRKGGKSCADVRCAASEATMSA
jgi:hypothetical protein